MAAAGRRVPPAGGREAARAAGRARRTGRFRRLGPAFRADRRGVANPAPPPRRAVLLFCSAARCSRWRSVRPPPSSPSARRWRRWPCCWRCCFWPAPPASSLRAWQIRERRSPFVRGLGAPTPRVVSTDFLSESEAMRRTILIPLALLVGCATPPEPAPDAHPGRPGVAAGGPGRQGGPVATGGDPAGARPGPAWRNTAGSGPPRPAWTRPSPSRGSDPIRRWFRPWPSRPATVTSRSATPPVNALIVRVNAEQVPAVVVLRDASWQARDRASLEIDEPRRTLRVRFHHAD